MYFQWRKETRSLIRTKKGCVESYQLNMFTRQHARKQLQFFASLPIQHQLQVCLIQTKSMVLKMMLE